MSWGAGIVEAWTPKGRKEIVAWVHDCFALDFRAIWREHDETPDGSVGWTVTHLPSGYAMFTLIMRLRDAQAIVEEVAGWAVDWRGVDPTNAHFLSGRVRALGERLGSQLMHSNHTIPPWACTEFLPPDPCGGPPKLRLVI